MDEINIVIAELQVALALVESKPVDNVRLKATLDRALEDLKAAIKAASGQAKGGGDT
jgi:hypothetical protein